MTKPRVKTTDLKDPITHPEVLADEKVRTTNPGKGGCGFYSIGIGLLPKLQEEILAGKADKEDSIFNRMIPARLKKGHDPESLFVYRENFKSHILSYEINAKPSLKEEYLGVRRSIFGEKYVKGFPPFLAMCEDFCRENIVENRINAIQAILVNPPVKDAEYPEFYRPIINAFNRVLEGKADAFNSPEINEFSPLKKAIKDCAKICKQSQCMPPLSNQEKKLFLLAYLCANPLDLKEFQTFDVRKKIETMNFSDQSVLAEFMNTKKQRTNLATEGDLSELGDLLNITITKTSKVDRQMHEMDPDIPLYSSITRNVEREDKVVLQHSYVGDKWGIEKWPHWEAELDKSKVEKLSSEKSEINKAGVSEVYLTKEEMARILNKCLTPKTWFTKERKIVKEIIKACENFKSKESLSELMAKIPETEPYNAVKHQLMEKMLAIQEKQQENGKKLLKQKEQEFNDLSKALASRYKSPQEVREKLSHLDKEFKSNNFKQIRQDFPIKTQEILTRMQRMEKLLDFLHIKSSYAIQVKPEVDSSADSPKKRL